MTQTLVAVAASRELANTDVARNVCGPLDANLRAIESRFGVSTLLKGLTLTVEGPNAEEALAVLVAMEEDARIGRAVDPMAAPRGRNDRGPVIPRTEGQRALKTALVKNTLTLAEGPAGTGKTQIATDCAVEDLKSGKVDRIVLTRPAVDAGEKLGFLPGGMAEKVDPYMRPLYDALARHYDAKALAGLIAEKIIEIAPVAFMRGRTLARAAVVVDEAQNLTEGQVKMILTRIGHGSTMALLGDLDQVDLPVGTPSGLLQAMTVLKGTEGVALVHLTNADCVRSAIVGRILDAYSATAKRNERGGGPSAAGNA